MLCLEVCCGMGGAGLPGGGPLRVVREWSHLRGAATTCGFMKGKVCGVATFRSRLSGSDWREHSSFCSCLSVLRMMCF